MESKLDTMAANEFAAVKALKAHLSLNVRNVEQSIEFYRKLLGIEPSKIRTGYAKFDVQNPPLNLALNEAPINSRGALSHLGIQVASTDDVLAMKRKWTRPGCAIRTATNGKYLSCSKTAFLKLTQVLAETSLQRFIRDLNSRLRKQGKRRRILISSAAQVVKASCWGE